jgi:hypothetical protein
VNAADQSAAANDVSEHHGNERLQKDGSCQSRIFGGARAELGPQCHRRRILAENAERNKVRIGDRLFKPCGDKGRTAKNNRENFPAHRTRGQAQLYRQTDQHVTKDAKKECLIE